MQTHKQKLENNRKYKQTHKKEISEYNKQYRLKNLKMVKTLIKKWFKANPDYTKKWKKNNPDKVKEYNDNFRKTHPDYYKNYYRNNKK